MSKLSRYVSQSWSTNTEIATVSSTDEPKIFSILHLLQEWGRNELNDRVSEAEVYLVQEGDAYHVMAYPSTSRLIYLSYNPIQQTLTSVPRHILVKALSSSMKNLGYETKEFEQTCANYKGNNFLRDLFGLGGNHPLLNAKKKALPGTQKLESKTQG